MFVTLGLGSVVSAALATAPWLAVISRHKAWVFAASALLLGANYWLVVVRPRRCAPGDICHPDTPSMRWNRRLFWVSVVLYVTAIGLTYGTMVILQRS